MKIEIGKPHSWYSVVEKQGDELSVVVDINGQPLQDFPTYLDAVFALSRADIEVGEVYIFRETREAIGKYRINGHGAVHLA